MERPSASLQSRRHSEGRGRGSRPQGRDGAGLPRGAHLLAASRPRRFQGPINERGGRRGRGPHAPQWTVGRGGGASPPPSAWSPPSLRGPPAFSPQRGAGRRREAAGGCEAFIRVRGRCRPFAALRGRMRRTSGSISWCPACCARDCRAPWRSTWQPCGRSCRRTSRTRGSCLEERAGAVRPRSSFTRHRSDSGRRSCCWGIAP